MPDTQTATEVLGMINWLAGERQKKMRQGEERAYETGMAQWQQASETARRINEMRISTALQEESKLQDQRTELRTKVRDIDSIVKKLNKIGAPPSQGAHALVQSELSSVQARFGTISQRQQAVDTLLNKLAERRSRLQSDVDVLAGAVGERAYEAEQAELGFKGREVGATEMTAEARKKSADADMYRAMHGTTVRHITDKTAKPEDPLLQLLGLLGATTGKVGKLGEEFVNIGTEEDPIYEKKAVYGETGGVPSVRPVITKAIEDYIAKGQPPAIRPPTGAPLTGKTRYTYINQLATQAEGGNINAKRRLKQLLPPMTGKRFTTLEDQAIAGDSASADELFLYERSGLLEGIKIPKRTDKEKAKRRKYLKKQFQPKENVRKLIEDRHR